MQVTLEKMSEDHKRMWAAHDVSLGVLDIVFKLLRADEEYRKKHDCQFAFVSCEAIELYRTEHEAKEAYQKLASEEGTSVIEVRTPRGGYGLAKNPEIKWFKCRAARVAYEKTLSQARRESATEMFFSIQDR